MTHHVASPAARRIDGFTVGRWVVANALGLGSAYGLWALLADGVEAVFGVPHGSLARDLAGLAGMLAGVAVFMTLRRRALAPFLSGSAWMALAAGAGLAAGFVVGFVVAGPPFDFVLGVIALGTIGGALQWRILRHRLPRPGGLLVASIGAWLAAGIAAGAVTLAVAVLAGDDAAGFLGGIAGFVALTLTIGLVGGAVGGALEGAALRRRIAESR